VKVLAVSMKTPAQHGVHKPVAGSAQVVVAWQRTHIRMQSDLRAVSAAGRSDTVIV